MIKGLKIPEGTAASKGNPYQFTSVGKYQTISSIMPFPENMSENKDHHLIFATSNGKIRKNNRRF